MFDFLSAGLNECPLLQPSKSHPSRSSLPHDVLNCRTHQCQTPLSPTPITQHLKYTQQAAHSGSQNTSSHQAYNSSCFATCPSCKPPAGNHLISNRQANETEWASETYDLLPVAAAIFAAVVRLGAFGADAAGVGRKTVAADVAGFEGGGVGVCDGGGGGGEGEGGEEGEDGEFHFWRS